VTDRYVLGLEVVLPNGEIVQFGGKCVKDVAGYNMVHMMVGSEGTFGIFTKIILRLIPLPTEKIDILALFKDIPSANHVIPEIMAGGHIIPAAVELLDRISIEWTCKYLNDDLPYQEAGAALLIEVDGNHEGQVSGDAEKISELCVEGGAFEVFAGIDRNSQERMWTIRHKIPDAFRDYSLIQCVEDVVVPISRIPDLMDAVERLAPKHHIMMPTYGHAGDGNMHVTLIKHPETSMEDWYRLEDEALTELYQIVKGMGGSISGEHGIGSKRREYLGKFMDPRLILLSKQIKAVFDPNQILNPGKIFA
jgi:glycolate oxidase